MGRISFIAVGAWAMLVGCGSEGGSVAVELRWAEAPQDRPAPGETWLHMSIRQADGNQQVAEPPRLVPGAEFEVPDVLYGEGIVIEAVVRESQDPRSPSCCSGASDAFDFEAGQNVAVTVELALQPDLTLDAQRISKSVRFIRSPFGMDRPPVENRFVLPSGPYFGLAPEDAFADVDVIPAEAFRFVGGVTPRAIEVLDASGTPRTTLEPNEDGDWPRANLGLQDPQQISVVGVGPRDVRSPPVVVREGWFVSTTADRETSLFAVRTTEAVGEDLVPDDGGSTVEPASLAAADGDTEVASGCADWEVLGRPPALGQASMATDTLRGRILLFGGTASNPSPEAPNVTSGETWMFDGTTWTRLRGPSPPSRRSAFMAYDAIRDEFMLFGGTQIVGSQQLRLDDTWIFDASGWHERSVAQRPGARESGAAVFDEARGVVLIFGGREPSGRQLDELWSWNGQAWAKLTPTGPRPTRRAFHSFAYEPLREVSVLFGGTTDAGEGLTNFGDTWTWDGTRWTLVSTSGPEPRGLAAMAFDDFDGTMVLHGGGPLSFVIQQTLPTLQVASRDDTWRWDGRSWTQIAASLPRPLLRNSAAMTTSPDGSGVVLFGGSSLNDTWRLEGSRWSRAGPLEPPPTIEARMVYDEARDELVLFGGSILQEGLTDETWTWNESGWRLRDPPSSPSPRFAHAMTFDAARGEVILFGGASSQGQVLGDTWRWDGETWTEVESARSPPPRVYAGMTYQNETGGVLVYGGTTDTELYRDTWRWDGQSWERVSLEGPGPRRGMGFVHDPIRGAAVLFGGTDGTGRADTWSFQQEWTELRRARCPATRAGSTWTSTRCSTRATPTSFRSATAAACLARRPAPPSASKRRSWSKT